MNSYLGFMWWDEETDGELMYPAKQKNPTAEEFIQSHDAEPERGGGPRQLVATPSSSTKLTELNPQLTKTRSSPTSTATAGCSGRSSRRTARGNLLDHAGELVGPPTPQKLAAAIDVPDEAKEFHQDDASTTPRPPRQPRRSSTQPRRHSRST